MSNLNSSPTAIGIIKDVGSITGKAVKLAFKGIGYTARGANNVLSFALDATKEGFNPHNQQPTQQEFNFEDVDDENRNQ